MGKPVETGKLENIDSDAIGLLAAEGGGLGAAMWKGTPQELVDRILPATTLPTNSPALNSLAQRFLLTTAGVPDGAATGGQSLTSIRIEKLVALGDAADAWTLAMMAKPDQLDDLTLRSAAEAALVSAQSKNVCDKLPALLQAHTAPEWQRLLVVCQLQANDSKSAQLSLEVLHTQNVKDDLFFALTERNIVGGVKSLPRQLTPVKPLYLALLRIIDQPLPSEIYAHPDATLIPELLKTKTRDDNPRLMLAERAAMRGIITGAQLEDAYRSTAATPDQLSGAVNGSDKNARQRALLFQAADAEKVPAKRLDEVMKFIDTLDETPFNGSMAHTLADMLGNLAPTGEYINSSAMAVKILLLADRPKEALAWLKFAREGAVSIPVLAAQLQDIWPLIVLSGLESDSDYSQNLGKWLAVELKDADRAGRERTGGILLLFDAAGFAVPEDAWAHVADLSAEERRVIPTAALLLERMRAAGTANRRGETVLQVLAIAGANNGEFSLMPTVDTVHVLRLTGLRADALAFARETVSSLYAPHTSSSKH